MIAVGAVEDLDPVEGAAVDVEHERIAVLVVHGGEVEDALAGEVAALDIHLVVGGEGACGRRHVVEGVDVEHQQVVVALQDRTGDAFVPGGVQVDVTGLLGDQVQLVIDESVAVGLGVAVDHNCGLGGRRQEAFGDGDRAGRAVIFRRIDRDGGGSEVAALHRDAVAVFLLDRRDREGLGGVDGDRVGGEVAGGDGEVGVDDRDIEVLDIADHADVIADSQGAGAADDILGAAADGRVDGLALVDDLGLDRFLGIGIFVLVILHDEAAEGTADQRDVGVAGDRRGDLEFLVVFHRGEDVAELAVGDGHVDGGDSGFAVISADDVRVGTADHVDAVAVGEEVVTFFVFGGLVHVDVGAFT